MGEILSFQHVQFSYTPEDHEVVNAVQDVSFSIDEGEWVAVVGHNGSGKSTIAKLICGLLFPQQGEIRFMQQIITEETIWGIRSNIGIVFQNPDNQFVGSTVQDDVAFSLENIGVPHEEMVKRVKAALTEVKMDGYMNHEPHHLSGGQKQRVAIAGTIAMEPQLLILDEATSMLDPTGRQEVIETVQALREKTGLTVISITHDLEEAALADRIIFMNEGKKYIEGKPTEIFNLGDELVKRGLDLPFALKVSQLLQEQGVKLNTLNMTEEELVKDLWTSNFKK
jgi:energy-coupling factor transport system ATP-binding protein